MAAKILVIDDEQGIRDLFKYLLIPEGFIVKEVSNGYDAVEIIKKNDFDLLFLDVHMKGMNGEQTLKEIKKIKPNQTVIISTSSSDINYIFEDKAKNEGAFDCIYKPFTVDEIVKTINEALSYNNKQLSG